VKVAVVAGICVERDAISAAAAYQVDTLATIPGVDEVVLFAQHHDRVVNSRQITVGDAWAFLAHRDAREADLVIFHWGIYYDVFNALPIVSQSARCAVYFHNLTPMELIDPVGHPQHTLSVAQMQLAAMYDTQIWTPSAYNVDSLVLAGFARDQVSFVPFPVEPPRAISRFARIPGSVQLLVVGRLVAAKGVDVLVEAMRPVIDELGDSVSLLMLGSSALSDHHFTNRLRNRINELGMEAQVTIRVDADDDELWQAYERSDVLVSPSMHEGLCVPVIEAYHAGCRVIASDAGNLPNVVQAPDPVVRAGDRSALAAAIVDVSRQVLAGTSKPPPGVDDLLATYSQRQSRESLVEHIGLVMAGR
jgi:glycosyltransferase involved in cell wall biosynthesis